MSKALSQVEQAVSGTERVASFLQFALRLVERPLVCKRRMKRLTVAMITERKLKFIA